MRQSVHQSPLFSERLHRHRNQQHQLLHLGPRRFHHPGGERPASDGHQHSGRLCPLPGKGTRWTPNSRTSQPGWTEIHFSLCRLRCSSSPARRSVACWRSTTRGTTPCGCCRCSSCAPLPSLWRTASCPSLRTSWTCSSSASPSIPSTTTAVLDESTTWTRP